MTDAVTVLKGFPFDNKNEIYTGSDHDWLLNFIIPRFAFDPDTLTEMKSYYNTSGFLRKPLVTLHITSDQQVPYWHQIIYRTKTENSGASSSRHFNIPVNRYGHCNFELGEVLFAFAIMLLYDGASIAVTDISEKLKHGEVGASFDAMAKRYQSLIR